MVLQYYSFVNEILILYIIPLANEYSQIMAPHFNTV